MKIIDACRLVRQEKGYLLVRNPVKIGQKCIEYIGDSK